MLKGQAILQMMKHTTRYAILNTLEEMMFLRLSNEEVKPYIACSRVYSGHYDITSALNSFLDRVDKDREWRLKKYSNEWVSSGRKRKAADGTEDKGEPAIPIGGHYHVPVSDALQDQGMRKS